VVRVRSDIWMNGMCDMCVELTVVKEGWLTKQGTIIWHAHQCSNISDLTLEPIRCEEKCSRSVLLRLCTVCPR